MFIQTHIRLTIFTEEMVLTVGSELVLEEMLQLNIFKWLLNAVKENLTSFGVEAVISKAGILNLAKETKTICMAKYH